MKVRLSVSGLQLYESRINYLNDDGFYLLSPWQRNFITSVAEQLKNEKSLSKKQMDQIESIFEKIREL